MKKWLPAIFILAAALIFFGVISLPHTGLPHSRAESLQWDGGSRPMTAGESDALAERLAGVKFNIRASGSTTLYMEHITVFFDDRKAQTILYCMEDGTLWLTVGAPFCGSGRPPGRGSVSCVLLDALQQFGLALHLSLDLPQCFKDIVQNEFFHHGGASLYFHYDIIISPEQRLLRRHLYPAFPDKNPYYAEQYCK